VVNYLESTESIPQCKRPAEATTYSAGKESLTTEATESAEKDLSAGGPDAAPAGAGCAAHCRAACYNS